jgi:cyclic pyranopterin monophosphate synthase
MKSLTHIDQNYLPTMVDVSEKTISKRVARAEGSITLNHEIMKLLSDNEIMMKKGPVVQTAIIAGTMAVKKTSDLIPFCHPLMIESCKFTYSFDKLNSKLSFQCEVQTTGKTGVEMEALTGVQVALLTVYDMCKAVSHHMTIGPTQLVEKTGGKSDFKFRALVLAGGQSKRMMQDKSSIAYYGKPHAEFLADLLSDQCDEVYFSIREDQIHAPQFQRYPAIIDSTAQGPMSGILEAFNQYPNSHWLVVACDMPFIDQGAIQELVSQYDGQKSATCYFNKDKNWAEPLFAIYSPKSITALKDSFSSNLTCMRKFIMNQPIKTIHPENQNILKNANSPAERDSILGIKS